MNKSNIIRAITLAVGMCAVLALTVPASASPRTTAASASGRGGITIHHRAIGLSCHSGQLTRLRRLRGHDPCGIGDYVATGELRRAHAVLHDRGSRHHTRRGRWE